MKNQITKTKIIFSKEDKKEIKHQYALLTENNLYSREYKSEKFPYTIRDEFQRDYARVLYSASFRRLQGKMQILGIKSSAFYRNRLTHSLEVPQIAKAIAFQLARANDNKAMYYAAPNGQKSNDLFCLEAAALCHDIGHPAFGHSGERVLDEIAKTYGKRFEGNAQNFRVLRTLDKYDPEWKGLNLTHRTLLAINKYIISENIKVHGDYVKKFMFQQDFDYLEEVRKDANLLRRRTLDVQIIELADDIAYAVHDLEDALSNRIFNIEELQYAMKHINKDSNDDTTNSTEFFGLVIDKAKKMAEEASSYKTLQEYSQVFRKKLVSLLTNSFINDIILSEVTSEESKLNGTDLNLELRLGELRPLCSILKKAIYECATRDEGISLYEKRGEIIIRSLFDVFADPKINKKGKFLPPDFRQLDEDDKYVQGSIDYIAGMMDTFAIQTYEQLFNKKFNEIPVK